MPEASTIDSKYVSRYAEQVMGIEVYKDGVLADADSNDVDVAIYRIDGDSPVLVTNMQADHVSTGRYLIEVTSALTSTTGHYRVDWSYTLDSVPDAYQLFFTVGETSPEYDALSPGFKDVVEQVWIRLADLYDSPFGGPHLQTYVQTHFNRNRIAQLLRLGLGNLNSLAQPQTTYTLDQDFPFAQWGALLELRTYIEVVKHLRRSYLEQPEVSLGASVARFDRRDYFQRWAEILADEKEELDLMMDNFKMAHMGLGNVHVLVSGGAYGNWGPYADGGGAGEAAARGYWVARRSW